MNTIKVGQEFELLVDASDEHGAISIDMRKRGGEPTPVCNLDLRVGLASRNAYRRTFLDRK